MKTIHRRILAVLGGLTISLGLLVFAVLIGLPLMALLHVAESPSAVPESVRLYRKFGDVYSTFSYVGLCLAGGAVFAALLWDGTRGLRGIKIAFWLLLLVLLPLSVLNYWAADTYTSRPKQALVDVALVVMGIICAASIARVQVASISSQVLKGVALFLLVMEAVLIPGMYAILWILNAQGAVSAAATRSFNPGWLSGVASVGALVISILNYRAGRSSHLSLVRTP